MVNDEVSMLISAIYVETFECSKITVGNGEYHHLSHLEIVSGMEISQQ